MSLLIVGCGYVGRELARLYLEDANNSGQPSDSKRVFAITRSEESVEQLKLAGVIPLVGHWQNLDCMTTPRPPETITHVVVAVPHRQDDLAKLPPDSDQHHVVGLERLYHWLDSSPNLPGQPLLSHSALPKLIYLSTTGVYGQTDAGQTVDETTPVSPNRIGPRIAVAAECWLSQRQTIWPSTIVRLAGIYGPGRIPLLPLINSGEPLPVNPDGRLNLIHVADIARAVLWLITAEKSDNLYLLSDAASTSRGDYYNYLAQLTNAPAPRYAPSDQESTRSKRSTDKQVDSSRFWQHSGLRPLYPTFRHGLTAIIRQGSTDAE